MLRRTVQKIYSMKLSISSIITSLSFITLRANSSTMVRQYRISKTWSQRWSSILKQSLLDLITFRGSEMLPTHQGRSLCMDIAKYYYIRRSLIRLSGKHSHLWPYSTKVRARAWSIDSCQTWRIWRNSSLCALSRRKSKSSPSTRTLW